MAGYISRTSIVVEPAMSVAPFGSTRLPSKPVAISDSGTSDFTCTINGWLGAYHCLVGTKIEKIVRTADTICMGNSSRYCHINLFGHRRHAAIFIARLIHQREPH